MTLKRLTILAVLSAAITTSQQRLSAQEKPADKPTDLPIKRVVLFSSGVGYFEHQGKVQGDATVELRFPVEQINDLLKSMVVEDQGGGRVTSVGYGARAGHADASDIFNRSDQEPHAGRSVEAGARRDTDGRGSAADHRQDRQRRAPQNQGRQR